MPIRPILSLYKIFFLCFGLLFAFSKPTNGNTLIETLEELIQLSINYQSIDLFAADSLAEIVIHRAKADDNDNYLAKGYELLATTNRLRNHNIKAIEQYSLARQLYSKSNTLNRIHEIDKWLGLCYAHESDYKTGISLLNSSLAYADSLGLIESKAQILLNSARLYKSKGDFAHSLELCKEAASLHEHLRDDELSWKINNFTGYMLLLNNKHREALTLLTDCLSKKELYKNNLTELYRLHFYIARINIFFKNYDNALDYLFITEDISKQMINYELGRYFLGHSQLYIGDILNQQKKYDSSRYYLLSALKNPEFSKDLHAMGHNYCYLGDLFLNTGDYDSAIINYKISADIHQNNKEIDRLNWAKLGLGKTYFLSGAYKKAKSILLPLVKSASQNLEIIEQTSFYLSQIFSIEKEFEEAHKYLTINKRASEELINEEKIREITKLEIENEYRTRQNELELVREHERSLYMAKLKLNRLTTFVMGGGLIAALLIALIIYRSLKQKKKAAEEKEVLLKEIHHRVKNNLQVISSMLNLQSKYLADSKIKNALTESQSRVKSMALIHQMLYQHEKFSEINIKEYINELCQTIRNSQNGSRTEIHLTTYIDNIWLDIDTAVPLGLIVNELLTNAYKYAFPTQDNGEIVLELTKSNSKYFMLKIMDNGIGLPMNIHNGQKTNTLGLSMVNILSKQLKGKLTLENTPGATFICEFTEIKKTTN